MRKFEIVDVPDNGALAAVNYFVYGVRIIRVWAEILVKKIARNVFPKIEGWNLKFRRLPFQL